MKNKTSESTGYDLSLLEWAHSEGWEPSSYDDLRSITTAPEQAEANEYLIAYWDDELADVYDNGSFSGMIRLDYFTMPQSLRGPKHEQARYELMQQLAQAIVAQGFSKVQSKGRSMEIEDEDLDAEID